MIVPSGMYWPSTVRPPGSTQRGEPLGTAGTSLMVSLMEARRNVHEFNSALGWISSSVENVKRFSSETRCSAAGSWAR